MTAEAGDEDLRARAMRSELADMFGLQRQLRDAWGIRPVTSEEWSASDAVLRASLWQPRFERAELPSACYRSEYGFTVHVREACKCER